MISPKNIVTAICLLLFTAFSACSQPPASAPAEDAPPYRIGFVGDILLGDAAQPYLDQHGYGWPFERLIDLDRGGYLIGNAEGPITAKQQPFDPDQRWSYNAQPAAAQALAKFGFKAIGLSNNHTFDRGPEGIKDTISHLETAGIVVFGAGLDLDQAMQPLLIETPYGLVAVVGLSEDYGPARSAGNHQAGAIPLSCAAIRQGIKLAKDAGASWVVAYVHWGENYSRVTASQRRWGREFSRAGYDMVIGHGAHSVQPLEVVNGMPVVYSLGNFVFGTPGRFSQDFPGFGLVVTTELYPSGFSRLTIKCIQTDNLIVEFQPRPCTPVQTQEVFETLHPDLIIMENTAALTW